MAGRFGAGVPDGLIRDRPLLAALLCRKQVRSRFFPTPVFPECFEQGWSEWKVATDTTLPTFHPNDHALTVDVANLQSGHFRAPHASAIKGHQQGALHHVTRRID